MKYTPLNIKSCYNFLTSALKVEDIVHIATSNQFNSIGIADDFKMFAFPSFYHSLNKAGIKPIFGMSLRFKLNEEIYSIYLYIRNENGYRTLCKFLSEIEPLSLSLLSEKNEDFVAVLPIKENKNIYSHIIDKDEQKLKSELFLIQKHFAYFYLGLECYTQQDYHSLEYVRSFVEEYPYETVAFNQIRYVNKNDHSTLIILNAIKEEIKLDIKQVLNQTGPYYSRTIDELEKIFTAKELQNSAIIADSINFQYLLKRGQLLQFPISGNKYDILRNRCLESLKQKLNKIDDNYIERIDYELEIIAQTGYLDYFLIVSDYVHYAKTNNIPVGPGRGSSSGSLVSYALDITEIDSIKYNLLFERFLNVKRVTMPDIDIDFADNKRNMIIQYLQNKYTKQKVAYITTFQTIASKQAIRDVGRVFNFNQIDINELCSCINYTHSNLRDAYRKNEDFRVLLKDQHFLNIITLASKIEGFPRQSGLHAAGILLNNENLSNVIPTFIDSNNNLVVEYEMNYLEEQGFLKMDILGLRNLTIIEDVLSRIKDLDLKSISLNDQATFDTLNQGYTQGIFQLESEGMSRTLKDIGVDSFDDIVAIIALYRPGPMDNIPLYAERKKHPTKITYPLESFKPILDSTYGVIIYQEQILQLVQLVASFDLGKADLFRRAISKKDASKMDLYKVEFINGAINNGIEENKAKEIFDLIYKFANYGFNKSHSVPYALITYQMAYLKTHYPLKFFASFLNFQVLTDNKYSKYLKELSHFNLKLGLPDINISSERFEIKDRKIILPLSNIKGMPQLVINTIIEERKKNGLFTSYSNFISRLSQSKLTQAHYISLINAGALDSFGFSRVTLRRTLAIYLEYFMTTSSSLSLLSEEEQIALAPQIEEYEEDVKLKYEKEFEVLGILLSGSLLEQYQDKLNAIHAITLHQAFEAVGEVIKIGLVISDIREITTKKGDRMAILVGNDGLESISIVIFPTQYSQVRYHLQKNNVLLFEGYIKNEEGRGYSLIANSISKLEEI